MSRELNREPLNPFSKIGNNSHTTGVTFYPRGAGILDDVLPFSVPNVIASIAEGVQCEKAHASTKEIAHPLPTWITTANYKMRVHKIVNKFYSSLKGYVARQTTETAELPWIGCISLADLLEDQRVTERVKTMAENLYF